MCIQYIIQLPGLMISKTENHIKENPGNQWYSSIIYTKQNITSSDYALGNGSIES